MKDPPELLSISGLGIQLLWVLYFNESVLVQAFFTLQLLSIIPKQLYGGKNNHPFPFSLSYLALRTLLRIA